MKALLIQLLAFSLTLTAYGQNDQIRKIKYLLDQKQHDKGLEFIDSLITQKQATNIVYYYKACHEQEKKLFERAIISTTTSLEMTANADTLYRDILFLRAVCYAYAGKLELAISDNETLVKEFPNNMNYLLNMSVLYGDNRQLFNCIKTLQHALAIDSSNVGIINNLAYYNNEVKDYQATIKYATKGLMLTKDSTWIAPLLNSLGLAQAKTISPEKGIQTILKSLTYMPNNAFAYFNLARVQLDKKEIEEACKNLRIARQLGGINLTSEYLKQYCN